MALWKSIGGAVRINYPVMLQTIPTGYAVKRKRDQRFSDEVEWRIFSSAIFFTAAPTLPFNFEWIYCQNGEWTYTQGCLMEVKNYTQDLLTNLIKS